jgi:outer membrane murein-binding lipoprotein Lpp
MRIKLVCVVFLSLCLISSLGFIEKAVADERDEEISALKTQVQELMKRIEKLEQGQVYAREEGQKVKEEIAKINKDTTSRVDMEKLASKLKLKGRWAAGYYDSGKAGSYPPGSFELPEAKVCLNFQPDDINEICLQLNLNNAAFNSVDYSFLKTDLTKLLQAKFPLTSILGKMKVDFGEEVWSNNPVEGVLACNSASNVWGSDEGVRLTGKLPGKFKLLGYSFSVLNGTSGSGSDSGSAKAFTGKISYNVIDPLYISASYYNSGSMKSSNADLSIAGLVTRPSGALRWSREALELDLRYDFKKGKILNPPAYSDSKAIFRLAYGGFSDDASGGLERSGQYGFLESTYNFNKKFYLAGRVSVIDLDGDTVALLNNINANEYQRYSLGLGYRLTNATILKLGYDWNKESGPGVDDADNNLLSAAVASQF